MIYVVLGMHKSGTTLVSESLHKSGISMGVFQGELGYDAGNKYERHETQQINRSLLRGYLLPRAKFFLSVLKNPTYNAAGYKHNSDSTAIFIRRKRFDGLMANGDIPVAINEVINDCGTATGDWGFKDPRTCYTYRIWKRALPEHKLVIVYRHYRNLLKRYDTNPWHPLTVYRILHSWTLHNQSILKHIQQTETPYVIVDYDKLMTDEGEFERISGFVGKELVDVRKAELYRNRHTVQPVHWMNQLIMRSISPTPNEVYKALEAARLRNIASPEVQTTK